MVRRVSHRLYLDNCAILNDTCRVDEIVTEKTPSLKLPLDNYVGIIIDSQEELEETLQFSFFALFRFYENMFTDTQWVWINRDADLDCFPHREKCFLGRWPLKGFSELRRTIKVMGGRNLIVRLEWLEYLQEKFECFLVCKL